MTQEALKLALEALKTIDEAMPFPVAKLAQAAIKEALAKSEQEPVIDKSAAIRIATSLGWSPQRTWVGLTEEEYKELHLQIGPVYYYQEYGQAIEAKLKEKNT